jgi:hypothetical protein
MTALLQVEKLCKSFGGITAVNNVSFDVREGEILELSDPTDRANPPCSIACWVNLRPTRAMFAWTAR